MSQIVWSSDGEKLFKKILDAVPQEMREMARPALESLIAAKSAGNPATPEIITRVVQEDLPEPQKSVICDALGISSAGTAAEQSAPPPEPDVSPEKTAPQQPLEWSGKSRDMFEIMLGEVPQAMQSVFRDKLTAVIAEKVQGAPVTDDTVTAVVNEIVPEPFKSTILKKFTELGDFDIGIVDDAVAKHGTSANSLMYILHDLQDAIGYLPIEALKAVSNKCSIPLSTVANIVTFYKSFTMQPRGTHHIKVCCGTACQVNDQGSLLKDINDIADRSDMITVEKALCLGCCDCSPAAEIDGTVFTGNNAKKKITSLLS